MGGRLEMRGQAEPWIVSEEGKIRVCAIVAAALDEGVPLDAEVIARTGLRGWRI